MLKILFGFMLIIFDIEISPDGKSGLDLLPDFIGFFLLAYGIWKVYKKYYGAEEFENVIKEHMMEVRAGVISGIISYVLYILNMYGAMYLFADYAKIGVGLLEDMLYIMMIFMYIQMLEGLQIKPGPNGKTLNFQVKRISMLWKSIFLCIICEYVSINITMAATTFFIFEKVIGVVFLVYVFTSDLIYKGKWK